MWLDSRQASVFVYAFPGKRLKVSKNTVLDLESLWIFWQHLGVENRFFCFYECPEGSDFRPLHVCRVQTHPGLRCSHPWPSTKTSIENASGSAIESQLSGKDPDMVQSEQNGPSIPLKVRTDFRMSAEGRAAECVRRCEWQAELWPPWRPFPVKPISPRRVFWNQGHLQVSVMIVCCFIVVCF